MSAEARSDLQSLRGTLRLFVRALGGPGPEVRPLTDLVERGLGWVRLDVPSTDGTHVYLPEQPPAALDAALARAYYRVAAAHQLGYLRHGTFELGAAQLEQAYPQLAARRGPGSVDAVRGRGLDGLLAGLPLPRLASAAFGVLEGLRVDAQLAHQLPGLAADVGALQRAALTLRAEPPGDAPAARALESLVRRSLGETVKPSLAGARAGARRLDGWLETLRAPGASALDSVRAVIDLIADWSAEGLGESPSGAAERSIAPVPHRGVLKPGLVMLLRAGLRGDQASRAPAPDGRARLQELLEHDAEIEVDDGPVPEAVQRQEVLDNILVEWRAEADASEAQGGESGAWAGVDEARIEGEGFVYDEWDELNHRYRARHCLVRERAVQEGRSEFLREVVDAHRALAARLRRMLSALPRQRHVKRRRLEDGEGFDLDAAIESAIDHRAGLSPSEKIFWRREKSQRSVATLFLVDVSASTAEPVHGADVEGERIIDREKTTLALLMHALGALDDSWGILAFSGYGRTGVDVHVVKALDEPADERVAARIEQLSPQYATRMGAAIRHASAHLAASHARDRHLIVLSDGRPQDQGYGEGGHGTSHAVADTHVALLEARRRGLRPFCLTLDPTARDYLAALLPPNAYEILQDIDTLPTRLAAIHTRLTA